MSLPFVKKLINSKLSTTLVLQMAAILVGLLSHYFFTQWMGETKYGYYAFGLSMLTIFTLVAKLGLDVGVLRFLPEEINQKAYGNVIGYLVFSISLIILTALLVLLGLKVLLQFEALQESNFYIIYTFLLALPFKAIIDYNAYLYQNFNKVSYSIIHKSIFLPILFCVLLCCFYQTADSFERIAHLYILAITIVCFSSLFFLKNTPIRDFFRVKPSFKPSEWLKVTIWLAIIDNIQYWLSDTDIFMLGLFSTPEQIGIYSIGVKISAISTIGVTAVNFLLAPRISKLFYNNKVEEIEKTLAEYVPFLALYAVTFVIGAVFLGKFILSIFGESYVEAYIPMLILVGSKIFLTILGPVSYMLSLTGKEKFVFAINFTAVLVNICLNFFLIQAFGIIGAAIGTAVAIGVRGTILSIVVKRHLKIKLLPELMLKRFFNFK